MRVFFYLFSIFFFAFWRTKRRWRRKKDPHQQRVQEAPGLLQVMPGA
jgi:hypothetical protein